MSTVQEINDAGQLQHYRLLWQSLLGETRDATFFQSLDWLEVYWKHFGAEQKLRVLLVYSDGKVIGILPMAVRRETTVAGAFRVLTFPIGDRGSAHGPIGPNPTATLLAGFRHLQQTQRDWDLLDIRWTNAGGGRMRAALAQVGMPAHEVVRDRVPVIQFSQGRGPGLARSAGPPQQGHQRCRAAGLRAGVSLVRYRPLGSAFGQDDPCWELYDACEAIDRRNRKTRPSGAAASDDESIRSFRRDAHIAAARAGAVDLNLLNVDGQPAAFAYNYHYRGRLSGLWFGRDDAACGLDAREMLFERMVEDSIARADQLYDLGAGNPGGAQRFVGGARNICRIRHYHPAVWRAQALRLLRRTAAWLGNHRAASSLSLADLAMASVVSGRD